MTDAYTPAANSTLASQSAPFSIAADSDVVSLSVSYGPNRPTETVWQQGAFCFPFLRSTRSDARTFVVVRDGGWPVGPGEPIFPWVNDPATATSASLQSNLYTADAMWTLLNTVGSNPPTIDSTDRSGNGRDLGIPNSQTFPALVSGRAAMAPILGPICVGASGVNTALLNLGAMTITAMVCPSAYDTVAGTLDEWIYTRVDYTLGTTAGNCTFGLLFGDSGGVSTLSYYIRNGASNDVVWSMSALRPIDGLWHFISASRNVAGTVVTLGLDGVYETSGTLLAPTGGASSIVTIGSAKGEPTKFQGAIYDVCHWPSALTNAQCEVLRKQAMGLP